MIIDLFKAVKDGKLSGIFTALMQEGVDVNEIDEYGKTVIHYALDPQVIELLASKGADVNAPDRYGKTPLDKSPNERVRAKLEELGAHPGRKVELEQDKFFEKRQEARDERTLAKKTKKTKTKAKPKAKPQNSEKS